MPITVESAKKGSKGPRKGLTPIEFHERRFYTYLVTYHIVGSHDIDDVKGIAAKEDFGDGYIHCEPYMILTGDDFALIKQRYEDKTKRITELEEKVDRLEATVRLREAEIGQLTREKRAAENTIEATMMELADATKKQQAAEATHKKDSSRYILNTELVPKLQSLQDEIRQLANTQRRLLEGSDESDAWDDGDSDETNSILVAKHFYPNSPVHQSTERTIGGSDEGGGAVTKKAAQRSRRTCYSCGRVGHIARNCPNTVYMGTLFTSDARSSPSVGPSKTRTTRVQSSANR